MRFLYHAHEVHDVQEVHEVQEVGGNLMKKIVIANQKGGVGKTTTANALAGVLMHEGKRVLMIDADPQCNTSDTYQAAIADTATLYDLLFSKEPVHDVIQHTEVGDIIAGDPLLSQADMQLTKTGKEFTLKKAMALIQEEYDFIIIDTAPSLGILLINALTYADSVIVPTTADRYSLQGLSQLNETIQAIMEYTNPDLRIAGLLRTRYRARTILSREVSAALPEIAEMLDTQVFQTVIRECTAAQQAQTRRVPLLQHAPKCTTALDYFRLVREIFCDRGE